MLLLYGGFPIVIGRADGRHYLQNQERDTTNNVVTSLSKKNKCNFNASPMMMSFFNYYSRFLCGVCKHTSGFIFAVLVSNYVAFASFVIDHFLLQNSSQCNKRSITFHMGYEKSLHTKSKLNYCLAKPLEDWYKQVFFLQSLLIENKV